MIESQNTTNISAYSESILESISDGVFTVNADWEITYFNRAAELITGIPRTEAMGSLCSAVFRSNMCEGQCALGHTLATGKPIINRMGFIINADGEKISVAISTALLKNSQGEIIGGAETFRDLTEIETLRHELNETHNTSGVIHQSQTMHQLMELAHAVAQSPSTVLIEGETGTGKEVLAKAIHQMSAHTNAPFIAINCGALPETLLESELFGYKKGAFTGATQNKLGRFALAKKGTLFLDEIGEISPALQVKLLRVLQERQFDPLGSIMSEKFEARVICATHRDLSSLIMEGTFRQDLFYRINIMTLHLPPLRERQEDIPLLANYFVTKLNNIQGRQVPGIAADCHHALMTHAWPGNVRELENLIERAFVLCGDSVITLKHLPTQFLNYITSDSKPSSMQEADKQHQSQVIINALKANGNNKAATAKSLSIHKTTLYRKMIKLGLQKPVVSHKKKLTKTDRSV